MKKLPVISGGNSEAVATAKAIRRYTIESLRTDAKGNERDAHINTFCFLAGVSYVNGVTLPQMMVCLGQLLWQVLRGNLKRTK